jgi:diguanylate cyclase (GGDEF)-like protein
MTKPRSPRSRRTDATRADTVTAKALDAVEDRADVPVAASVTVLSGIETGRTFVIGATGGLLGRGADADLSFDEETISRRHARIDLDGASVTVTDLRSHNGTFVDGEHVPGTRRLPAQCRLRLGSRLVLQVTALDRLAAEALEQQSRALLVDPLTGTGNRRHLQQRLEAEIAYAKRHASGLCLLLLDLDHFKQVNDTHGHLAGDAVLAAVGQRLASLLRVEDQVFRYGGEEFCLLLRGQGSRHLRRVAERVRDGIAGLDVPWADVTLQVTVSVGGACLAPDEHDDDQSILLRADEALYRAKDRGRNRFEFCCGDLAKLRRRARRPT